MPNRRCPPLYSSCASCVENHVLLPFQLPNVQEISTGEQVRILCAVHQYRYHSGFSQLACPDNPVQVGRTIVNLAPGVCGCHNCTAAARSHKCWLRRFFESGSGDYSRIRWVQILCAPQLSDRSRSIPYRKPDDRHLHLLAAKYPPLSGHLVDPSLVSFHRAPPHTDQSGTILIPSGQARQPANQYRHRNASTPSSSGSPQT